MLIYLPTGRRELNVKALVGAFNQEKALVGAFSVITNLRMDIFQALETRHYTDYTLGTPSHHLMCLLCMKLGRE